MRFASKASLLICGFCLVSAFAGAEARAQQLSSIALKNGESLELGTISWAPDCRSIMIGVPEIEILQGPPGLTMSIKEAMVTPRRLNCPTPVPGGIIVATAKDVTEPVQGKLTYRIKVKTKDGDRQTANSYNVSLFP
jgi:hypothetical protein